MHSNPEPSTPAGLPRATSGTLQTAASLRYLEEVRAFVDRYALAAALPDAVLGRIEIALEEAFVNICSYAYARDRAEAGDGIQAGEGGAALDVAVRCRARQGELELELVDHGAPFNLLEADPPDLSEGIEERQVGGLGIHLVRQLSSDVHYRREGLRNILTMVFRSR